MVEIRAEIICIFFKLFQKEEENIQKTSEWVIKKMLNIPDNPFIAFPNTILRECVRPILNYMNMHRCSSQQFLALSRLIKVLHSQFNPILGTTIFKHLGSLTDQIKSNYVFKYVSHDAQRRGLYPNINNLPQGNNMQANQNMMQMVGNQANPGQPQQNMPNQGRDAQGQNANNGQGVPMMNPYNMGPGMNEQTAQSNQAP
jgi:hypothetical protein